MQEMFVVRGLASTEVQTNSVCHYILEKKPILVLSILDYPSSTADKDKKKKKKWATISVLTSLHYPFKLSFNLQQDKQYYSYAGILL